MLLACLLLVSQLATASTGCLHSSTCTAGIGGLSSQLHKLMDLLVSAGDKWAGALFWNSRSWNKGEDPVSASVKLTPSKEKLHSLAHDDKAPTGPCSDEMVSKGGQEPL